ncbi:ribosomal RNA processing protein [Aureococcus anophagefferens]|uniref:Ribosomal RNA processing protein n=1 Tax=Aureococcus anophagefferens TaxID=44056 RepID=A0ABR1FIG7_AURAN
MARHSKAANRTHKKRSSPGDQQQQQLPAASPLFFNCECVFSLFLVALLAALPFNINAGYFRQSRESFVMRAEELFSDGAFGTAAALYQRAVDAEETPDGHVFLAETLVRVARVPDAIAHYERAAALYDDARERVAALASAARLHVERGSAAEAVAAYVRVLELDPGLRSPEVADAHVQLAAYSLGAGSRGGLYAAVGHLRRATEIAPTLAAAHLLLADGYRDLGLPEHAIESLRSVVKYRPRDAAGLSGLGAAHLELGHFKQSVNAYRKAHALAPAATDVKYALAALLGEPVVPPRAPPSYVEALFDLRSRRGFLRADAARGPPPPGWDLAGLEALRNASDAPADAKRRKKKKDAPRSASEATVLETISAILTGDKGADEVQRFSSVEEAIKAAPLPPLNGTVQDEPHLFAQVHGLLFDDQLLDVVLETLRSALVVDGDADGGGRWLDVLELGCGDGVAGQHLRTLANRLHCVDLSAGALAVAEARRAYDVLERGEFVSTARALLPDSQDLVVAVDAVPYLGDLADFFGAVASVLRPGGLAIFNTDVLTEDGLEPGSPKKARDKAAESEGEAAAEPGTIDYRLAFTGRWQHRVKYVTGLARAHGFASVKPTMLLKVETRLVWNAREQKAGWVERGSKEARDAAIRTGVFAFRKED